MNTAELIRKCEEKDPKAWDIFISRYRPLVLKSIRYKLRKLDVKLIKTEMHDIEQEVFLSIWEKNKLKSIRNIDHLRTWLAMLTINRTSTYCRKHVFTSAKSVFSLDTELPGEDDRRKLEDIIPDRKLNTADNIAYNELNSLLLEEIEKFSSKQQLALKFRFIEGRAIKDIANIMKMPEGTVSAMISRCKRQIKPEMDRLLNGDNITGK